MSNRFLEKSLTGFFWMFTRNPTLTILLALMVGAGCVSFACAAPVRIYGRDNFNKSIPADPQNSKGPMEEATITITDNFTISDLDVIITIDHTNVFDLQLFLESPAKTRICLNIYDFKKEFFKGKGYTQTRFDDEAALGIEHGRAPFNGRFRPKAIDPQNLLAAFDGESLAGTWKLQVYDSFFYDTGYLKTFKLIVTIPEPASAVLLTFGILFAMLPRPRRS